MFCGISCFRYRDRAKKMRRERAGKDSTVNGGSTAATTAAAAAAAAAATAEQGRQLGGKYDNEEEVGLQSQQSGSHATWEGGSTYVSTPCVYFSTKWYHLVQTCKWFYPGLMTFR